MRMGCASLRAGGETVDQGPQASLFCAEVALLRDYEFLGRRGISAKRLFVPERHSLDEAADDSADEHALELPISEGRLQADCTVRHCLTGRHSAPHSLTIRSQSRDASSDIFHNGRIE
jgi:hypothetical protein